MGFKSWSLNHTISDEVDEHKVARGDHFQGVSRGALTTIPVSAERVENLVPELELQCN